MIHWPIRAALDSGAFDKVIVSTDDPEIAEIAREVGAEVPFVRPPETAHDTAGLTEVVRHAIQWFREHQQAPEIVACAYATAPFLRPEDLAAAVKKLTDTPEADYVLAVTTFASPVDRAIVQEPDGWLRFMWPEFATARSQDIRQAYHDAGHFFMGKAEAFMKYPTTLAGHTLPHVVPRLLCQDIDTEEDWEHAAALFAFAQAQKQHAGSHHHLR